jgi:DNA-binding CsgD family transcriptional regulator
MAISQIVLAPEGNARPIYLQTGECSSMSLQTAFDNWVDGVFIFDHQGQCIIMNQSASKMIEQLSQTPAQLNHITHAIRQTCFMVTHQTLSHAESELHLNNVTRFRIRGRTFHSGEDVAAGILIILEDQMRSLENLVNTESVLYHLTPREKAVWLLYRMNQSYQDIAKILYISANTIKKHLKSIRSKQRSQKMLSITD